MGDTDETLEATLQTPQGIGATHTPHALAGTHTPVSLNGAPDDADLPVAPPHRYVIERDLGAGGQSIVYAARDAVMGREVALKTSRDPSASAGFVREVRITAQLEHPGIIPVHELGRTERGEFFCTQKLVRGRTLRAALDEAKTLEARLALLPHLVDVCNAMAYAHSRGVVHRDLKPENVMVGEFGETVVLDWGVARVGGSEIARVERPLEAVGKNLTAAGDIIGTPMYLSPEQARGRSAEVDARSDVWSLGVMLYELVAGRRPFQAATLEAVLLDTVAGKYAPLSVVCPDAPPELDAVAAQALRLEPSQRYADARALAADLSAFRAGGRVAVYRYSSWELLRRFVGRNRAFTATALAALVGLLVAMVVVMRANREANLNLMLSRENLAESLVQEARNAERSQLWNEAYALYRRSLDNLEFEQDFWASALLSPLVAEVAERWPGGKTSDGAKIDRLSWAAILPEGDQALAWDYRLEKVLRHDAAGWHAVASAPTSGLGAIHGKSLAWISGSAWLSLEGAPPREVPGTQDAASLAFSADASRLAVARPGKVTIFETATLAELQTLEGGAEYPYVVRFSPDGTHLVGSAEDGTVRWWKLATEERTVATGPRASMLAFAFSPDGKRLFSGDDERNVWVWNLETATTEGQLVAHERGVQALAIAPRGDLLASASSDGSLVLWDLLTLRPAHRLSAGARELFAVAFSNDGQRVDAVDTTGKRWSWTTAGARQASAAARCPLRQMAVDAAWSPSSATVAFACGGSQVLVVEPGTAAHTVRTGGPQVTSLVFSKDGAQLWLGTTEGTVEVWSARSWSHERAVRVSPKGSVRFTQAAGPDGIAAAVDGAAVRLEGADFTPRPLVAASGEVARIDLAADGQTLAWMGEDLSVWTRRTSGGGAPQELALPGPSRRFSFSPRGDLLAAVGDYGVAVVELSSGKVSALEGFEQAGIRVSWSPDGSFLAAGGVGGVALFDAARRRLLAEVPGQTFEVSALAWAPDGRAIAFGNTAGHLFVRRLGPEVNVKAAPNQAP